MEIWHLRYFVAAAEEGTVARAADRLHMAASPLSRRIRDLERELGVALFVRAHHRLELTPDGADLLPRAADVVARFDAIAESAAPARMTVGIAPDVSAASRDLVLAAIAEACPGVEVVLAPAHTGPLLASLRAGDLGLAVAHGPIEEPGVDSVLLERRRSYAVVGRGTALGDRTSVHLSELADLAFASIDATAAPALYGRLDEALRAAGVHRRATVADSNFAGVAQLVAAGQAFTLSTRDTGTAARLLRDEDVVFLEVDGAGALSTHAVWGTARIIADPRVRDAVAAIRRAAAGGSAEP
ncbi:MULTISPECIES: LysR family transcriptional regulator [Tsukamurella]|uniref:LysR family transcriptional regulator n=2 Tax=Tsukamurella TaxID=2060 RepID=A0A5C5RXH2_9ACTN|nr:MULTISPECIES: LysR family transcriptional regulator [Tsukamurella]NMD56585.1 LysR family transcriptional regulator [Tsukamurella columbiensis]TWS27484.1 LysR family transcriptional regulator [Tsukamurella conjunctivitidis]